MLKLKLHYFGHLMQRADSWEETLMLGKTEGRRGKDEMVGWHHRLNGYESEQTLGDSEGQGSLACCSLWGHKKSDTTKQLNNNQRKHKCGKHNSYITWVQSFHIYDMPFMGAMILMHTAPQ